MFELKKFSNNFVEQKFTNLYIKYKYYYLNKDWTVVLYRKELLKFSY